MQSAKRAVLTDKWLDKMGARNNRQDLDILGVNDREP